MGTRNVCLTCKVNARTKGRRTVVQTTRLTRISLMLWLWKHGMSKKRRDGKTECIAVYLRKKSNECEGSLKCK